MGDAIEAKKDEALVHSEHCFTCRICDEDRAKLHGKLLKAKKWKKRYRKLVRRTSLA